MWLLHTNTGELQHFNGPNDVKGGYAILSHVWQDDEQSFQELQALRTQLASTDYPDPGLRPRLSAKIRECCVLAESHGYDWLWIDTCCIDRASSAELSEAINSMFDWYARAQVCYAYLFDVPPLPARTDAARRGSAFRTSRWFTRGWTLQELIAPRSLLFVASDWTAIGTKGSLAPLLQEITGIDADVLTFRRALGDVSVARRMSWASTRTTTRLEDEAYCLMGIFGVHMATIYGEGQRAFLRLQEEILKRTSDQTLFAWGNVLPIRTAPFREHTSHSNYHHDSHIFAPSPAAFVNSSNMVPVPMTVAMENAVKSLGVPRWALETTLSTPAPARSREKTWKIPLPDFTATSHGVRARLLIVESSAGRTTLAIAVLACKDTANDSFVGLLLRRRVDNGIGLQWPRYYVGTTVRGWHSWMRLRYRLAQVDWARHALSFSTCGIAARWQRLYISHRPPSLSPPAKDRAEAAFRFHFPRWLAVELEKAGFRPAAELPTRKIASKASLATFTFTHERTLEALRIHVGLCSKVPWATATFIGEGIAPLPRSRTRSPPAPSGDLHPSTLGPALRRGRSGICDRTCGPDAISSWTHGSRVFGDSQRNVQLTFTRLNGGGSHLLDVRVGGSVYERAKAPPNSRAMHVFSRAVTCLASHCAR
ncbi:heterokaryon incompatibility protein-domain-containing protein [Trametes gibbosa]|nr:heterokaryon incompatibility protein-domain-containing protein [Trametes gibbosa]